MVNPMMEPTSEPTKSKWDWKSCAVGILIALGLVSTYAAAKLGGTIAPESKWLMTCASSHVVLEQKKRCGFLDLGELVTAEGVVIRTKIHNDGDSSINIRLDPRSRWLLTYKGRKTRDYLHVEFMPCERTYADVESVLVKVREHVEAAQAKGEKPTMRVRITGRWAYDGVDHRGKWKDQIGNCIDGRDADPAVGWTEIHPAYTVEILNDTTDLPTK